MTTADAKLMGPSEGWGPGDGARARQGRNPEATPEVLDASSSKAVRFAVALAIAVGCALRGWLLFHHGISSDEAVIGLMARQILHGHLYAFNWGQPYGGVEPYVVAAVFAVAGQSGLTLAITPVLLSVIAAVLFWRVARRLVRDPALAALGAALFWAAPLAVIYQSTIEDGYRGVVMVCGMATLLLCLRILDGHHRFADLAGLGLFAGLGWWSLPEVVYFFLPAGLILLGAVVSAREIGGLGWAKRGAVTVVAFCLGALPWIWENVRSGFASLNAKMFPGANTPLNPGYGGRLKIFFHDSLPLQLDLRRIDSGVWIVGPAGTGISHRVILIAVIVVVLLVVAAALAACVLRRDRAVAIAVGVIAFPFLVAAQPGSWFWQDGRYAIALEALLALALVAGAEELGRRLGAPVAILGDRWRRIMTTRRAPRVPRALMATVLAGSIVLSLLAFGKSFGLGFASFFNGWGDPDQLTHATIASLERQGIRTGFADYWVAYKLDFLSGDRLAITVGASEPDRWTALDRQVRRSRSPAWLFIPAAEAARAAQPFGEGITGPGGVDETTFLDRLDRLKIPYRIIDAGVLQAVLPRRRVEP